MTAACRVEPNDNSVSASDPQVTQDTDHNKETTFTDITVSIHPQIGSLLIVEWNQSTSGTGTVMYRIGQEDWMWTPEVTTVGLQTHVLLGMPYDTDVSIVVSVTTDQGESLSEALVVRTDPAPVSAPQVVVSKSDPSRTDTGVEFFLVSSSQSTWQSGTQSWVSIIDRQGRLVWAVPTQQGRISLHARLSYDEEDILYDQGSFWTQFDFGAQSQIQRMKIDGTVVAVYDTPGLHHPFTETADGSLIWGAMSSWNEETLVERNAEGEILTLWNCREFLDSVGMDDDCGSNTVFWEESTDTILFSQYNTDTIFEIDRANKTLVRWFGNVAGAWDFEQKESQFWWQHGAHFTEDGHLMVSCKGSQDGSETVIREYALNESGQTLEEVWSFGEGRGVYGPEMGEAHRLDNGNTLHNYGSQPLLLEATPQGDVVWQVAWKNQTYIGRTTPLSDLYDLLP